MNSPDQIIIGSARPKFKTKNVGTVIEYERWPIKVKRRDAREHESIVCGLVRLNTFNGLLASGIE